MNERNDPEKTPEGTPEKIAIDELAALRMRLVERLAAGVAHAVNNPLSGIAQSTQLLCRSLNLDDARVREQAERFGLTGETKARVEAYLEDRGVFRFLRIIEDCARDAGTMIDTVFRFVAASGGAVSLEMGELIEKTLFLARHDMELRHDFGIKQLRTRIETEAAHGAVACLLPPVQHALIECFRHALIGQDLRGIRPPILTVIPSIEADAVRIVVESPLISEGAASAPDSGTPRTEAERSRLEARRLECLAACSFLAGKALEGRFEYRTVANRMERYELSWPPILRQREPLP